MTTHVQREGRTRSRKAGFTVRTAIVAQRGEENRGYRRTTATIEGGSHSPLPVSPSPTSQMIPNPWADQPFEIQRLDLQIRPPGPQ